MRLNIYIQIYIYFWRVFIDFKRSVYFISHHLCFSSRFCNVRRYVRYIDAWNDAWIESRTFQTLYLIILLFFLFFFFFNSRFRRTRSKTAEEKVGETIGSIGSEMSCKINRAVPQLDLSLLLLLLLYGFFFHAHACTNRRMHAHAKKFTLINFNQ